MKVSFSPPDISEAEVQNVVEVLRSGWITTGPVTKKLERDIAAYCGVKRVACLNSATAAMELSLRLLGVGPGDEVITSAYTYTASASVIAHVGAKIVMADTLPGDLLIDPASVADAITEKTKAVISVDVAGIPVDYDGIRLAADEKRSLFSPVNEMQEGIGRVAVVADAAHAFGAVYRDQNVAQLPEFSCFSFHAVKNFTTSEGGCVCFSDVGGVPAEEIYRQFMLLSLHGQSKDALSKDRLGQWEYDILLPGYKCNMTDILAAIGAAQLLRYPEMLRRRRELLERYNRRFEGTRVRPLRHIGSDYAGSLHAYIVRIDGLDEQKRNRLMEKMGEREIALNVHFKPLPLMTAYRGMGFRMEDYPNAYDFYRSSVTLPLFSTMTDKQADFVADELLRLLDTPGFLC